MLDTRGQGNDGAAPPRGHAPVHETDAISWRTAPLEGPTELLAIEVPIADAVVDHDGQAPDTDAGATTVDHVPSAPDSSGGRVITVLCPKGGVGRTTVATNVAIGLARIAPGSVAIVDLDLQFGDLATALKLAPRYTFTNTRARPPDGPSVQACLTPHPANLFALCAPNAPVDAEELTPEHTKAVLAVLAQSFQYVVIDTPAGLDEHTLNAIDLSTDLVVVSATDVPAVRNTRKELEVLRVISQPHQRTHLVLNRADARTGLHRNAIESVLGLEIEVEIPSSGTVPLALNQGTPILEADAGSPVSRAMARLVRDLVPKESAAKARRVARRAPFSRRRAGS